MTVPYIERAVIVFYPHTSNWDFVIGLLARFAIGIPVTWAGKDTLFRRPFARLWTALGGIAVNRRERTGFVAQMADAFRQRPRMLLAIAPEGTRTRTAHWRTGFYRVALAARVPIALGFIDYGRREIGVGALVHPRADIDADFAAFRAFYSGTRGESSDATAVPIARSGRHPEQASPIVPGPSPVTASAAPAERPGPEEPRASAASVASVASPSTARGP